VGEEQELLESAAVAIGEIAGVLEKLRTTYPNDSVIQKCVEVQQQLTWYLSDAREKLNRRELKEQDAAALALIISRGLNRMISIVEAQKNIAPGSK
jgi:CHASE3 domain sensor protein